MAAIEKLHGADVEATLAQDPNLLNDLWSDDCVKLGVPRPAIIGKKGMQEVYRKFRADHPDFKVLKYAPEIQDIQIADGWAIEWVYYETTFRMSAKDSPVSMRRKDLRVLKRQRDGSWKLPARPKQIEGRMTLGTGVILYRLRPGGSKLKQENARGQKLRAHQRLSFCALFELSRKVSNLPDPI